MNQPKRAAMAVYCAMYSLIREKHPDLSESTVRHLTSQIITDAVKFYAGIDEGDNDE